MDIETKFNDLGVDAVLGFRLMSMLGLNASDFVDESRFLRFKDVITFFKNNPDTEYIINKITTGKSVDRLDHVWGYTELSNQKSNLRQELSNLIMRNDALSSINDDYGNSSKNAIQSMITEKGVQIKKIDDQMSAYEK